MHCEKCNTEFEGGTYCPECGSKNKKGKLNYIKKNLSLLIILVIMVVFAIIWQSLM